MSYFPGDFIWGTACAAYQCEGAWDADGKGRNIWDDYTHDFAAGHIANNDTGDTACDSYHRYKEDIALMKRFGFKVYRFSISWARVIPDGSGEVNEKGLQYYDSLVDELLANGIEPYITLYHWDLPSALSDRGGWLNPAIVPVFGRYAEVIAEHFKGRVKVYMTINEPQCISVSGYGRGEHAPGWRLPDDKVAQVFHNLALAHSEAYRRIKAAAGSDVTVGVVSCGRVCYPAENTPECTEAAYNTMFNLSADGDWGYTFNIFLDDLILHRYDDTAPESVRRFAETVPASDWEKMEKPDFIGINNYQSDAVLPDGSFAPVPAGFPRTALKWKITPEGMYYGPKFLHRRYGLPLMITENGLSCNDKVYLDGKVHDADRIDFLRRYLREVSHAVQDGIPLLGYLSWSFLDNFEWAQGYNERFGLIYVDYQTFERIPKDSAAWYSEVIKTNGKDL